MKAPARLSRSSSVALFAPRPKVAALARAGDVEALREAACHQDVLPDRDGLPVDLGVPVREQAVAALGQLSPARVDDAVVAALGDPSDRVRLAAVRVCAEQGDATLLATAIASIPQGQGEARVVAITELLESGQTGMSRLLAEALVHSVGGEPASEADLMLIDTALDAEARGDARGELVEALIEALRSDSDEVADRAEAMLVHLAPASVERLIEELERGRAAQRAASALGRAKDMRALAPLVEGLEHPHPELRAECCVALGELRDPAAIEALLRATRDAEHSVRAQAGWALDHLGTLAVVVGVSTLMAQPGPAGGNGHGGGGGALPGTTAAGGLPGAAAGGGHAPNGDHAATAAGNGAAAYANGRGADRRRRSALRHLARMIDELADRRESDGPGAA